MVRVSQNTSIREYQAFNKSVYRKSNDKYFGVSDMLGQIQRFAMRGLKGIRKGDHESAKNNLIISFSWLMSLLNRPGIDIEDEIWKRFPYKCSYCASVPCSCKEVKPNFRHIIEVDHALRPGTMKGFQQMFEKIYPASARTLDHACVHFAEEIGEFTEAMLAFRSSRSDADFENIKCEAADYFSCFLGIFNSLNVDLAQELANLFKSNCHVCEKAPCDCSFDFIKQFKF